MLDIEKFAVGKITADVRSALYYVGRYIKQASFFNTYSKDIFEDDEKSAPSKVVRDLAMEILQAIELHEGVKAADIKRDRVFELIGVITSLEDRLNPDISESELAAAEFFTETMDTPRVDN
jgi:hypothetical protein